MLDYTNIKPIESRIPAERQSAKRHYGVHPYFTRRPHNVVRKYILHYSKEKDVILDPFGGSGITAIESFLENRIGIHNDINPLANFITRSIIDLSKGNLGDYKNTLIQIENSCKNELLTIEKFDKNDLNDIFKSIELPPNTTLPRNSDVAYYYDLFTKKQLLSLAILKNEIDRIANPFCRNAMLLAWSATLAKLNKTFLSTRGRAESRGGSSIFSIYRYKIAKTPVELPAWDTFHERALNIFSAKEEIDNALELKKRTNGWNGQFEEYALDIEELSQKFQGKIDYIFTDPPYGGHISYIDLSTLWNSWLGLSPSLETRKKELIVGGELKLTEQDYIDRLYKSIRTCMQMLKPNRWLSVVFQHWNIDYFKAILSGAEDEGGQLRAAISQVGDPIWSMHKKKNKESVLSGEMILTFFKSDRPIVNSQKNSFDLVSATKNILNNTQSSHLFGEYLFNKLVIEAWKSSSIENLNINKNTFTEILNGFGWRYNPKKHYWTKKKIAYFTMFDF
jgi:16S rRNA G966 N2-methylase RsmD